MVATNSEVEVSIDRREYLRNGFQPAIPWQEMTAEDWLVVLQTEMREVEPHLRYLGAPTSIDDLIRLAGSANLIIAKHRIYPSASVAMRVINHRAEIWSGLVPTPDNRGGRVYIEESGDLIGVTVEPNNCNASIFLLSHDVLLDAIEQDLEAEHPECQYLAVPKFITDIRVFLAASANTRLLRVQTSIAAIENLGEYKTRVKI